MARDVGTILLVFVIMWLFNQIPTPEPWRSIINGVVMLVLILILFGVRL